MSADPLFPPDPGTVAEAADLLCSGRICAFPTETVYGLGADATNSDAVLAIYEAKGRPRFNPLIVHCADVEMARDYAMFSPLAEELARRFWPGPLTLVLPKRAGVPLSDICMAGLDTVALRVPAHPIARELVREVGRPLAAPSANPSGRLSPTTANQVRLGFANRVPVLDGGPSTEGVESTILAVEGDTITQLRAGALPRAEIERATGREVLLPLREGEITAPGMLASHYAPNARLRLNAKAPEVGEAWLGFGPDAVAIGPHRNLSPGGDLREAARNLFSMLHELDASGAAVIAVAPIPKTGLGEAINDRLARAASPRPTAG